MRGVGLHDGLGGPQVVDEQGHETEEDVDGELGGWVGGWVGGLRGPQVVNEQGDVHGELGGWVGEWFEHTEEAKRMNGKQRE